MSLTAWTLTDGAAGNLRQVRALASALGADADEVLLRARPPWRWLSPRALPGATHAFGATFADRLEAARPDLVIGCGRQAALATRLLADGGLCRSVQILDPRLDPSLWDLVVAPAHDRVSGSNVLHTVGSLNPVDEAWLAAARRDWPGFGRLPSPRTLLLIGGPTAAAPMTPSEWNTLADRLQRQLQASGGSLLLSSSRRTPDWLREAARQRFAGIPGRQWHGPADGDNPYPGMLAWAERIVCTADSVNLLSEACATGVPVNTLLPAQPSGRIARFHRALLDSDRLRPLDEHFEPWSYTPLREAAEVAVEIRRRLQLPDGTGAPGH